MGDPITAGAAFAFLNSAFKLAEFAVKINAVESENGVFVRMIQRVRLDLEETERLLCVPSVKKKLASTPGKLPWIQGSINSTKRTLNDIGRWVERVRSDKEGYGSISWENRVRWVFNDHDKLVTRRMELGTSHQTLSTVLSYLAPLEQTETAIDEAPPQYEESNFSDDFLSPRQKRKKARNAEKSFGAEKKDEGTPNEVVCQPIQAPSSEFFTPQPIARKEFGSGGDVNSSGHANSSQASNPPSASPWSTTTGRKPILSIPPSTIGSNPFPNSTPMTIFSGPTTQEWSSQTPQSFEGTNTYISDIYPQSTSSHQLNSSTLSPVSYPTSLQQFSATNFEGPLDPFELLAESDAQDISIRPQNVDPVAIEPVFAIQHPVPPRNPPVPPKTCQSSAQTDKIAEMMGDLLIYHPENNSSLTEIPKYVSLAQSPSTDSYSELPTAVPFWQEMPAPRSELPGDAIIRKATCSTSVTEVSAEPYHAIERSQNPPPQFGGDIPTGTYAEMPSHAISHVPQHYQQYPPSIQPQIQPQFNPQYQSQYQPYSPPIPTPVSHRNFSNPISIGGPPPISWQEQHQQIIQAPVSPPTQEATIAQPAGLAVEQEYSFSRPTTLGEARRRNQKAILDLMDRGNYM